MKHTRKTGTEISGEAIGTVRARDAECQLLFVRWKDWTLGGGGAFGISNSRAGTNG